MKVCVVGSGGREHALALALARSAEVVVTPGSAEMAGTSPQGFPISVTDAPPQSVDAALVVIGPEQPLVDGLADRLRADGRLVFGPGADGARLEGSKAFMKQVLSEARVPTARYGAFDDAALAKSFLRQLPGPWVVKTDGLAAGKGVLVTGSLAEAEADVDAKLSGAAFGDAGRTVVVEEGLEGTECSLLALCDGRRVVPLPVAQDFKRLEDGDEGPNTGGMGAYSPVPWVGDDVVDRVLDEAVEPLVAALRRRGVDYRGVLYAGLMLTDDGPKVLEYNVRFGDPETQVVLPRVDDDLVGLLAEAAAGRLRSDPRPAPVASVCVVLAAPGYPGSPRWGEVIDGIAEAGEVPGVSVLHAGTARDERGRLVSAGGRVLGIRCVAADLELARSRAYEAVSRIDWPAMCFRSDIARAAALVPARSTTAPPSVPAVAGVVSPSAEEPR